MCIVLQGGDSSGASVSGVGSIAALVATAHTLTPTPMPGTPYIPPATLLALARNNPSGRELNLGLGKNQFSVGSASKGTSRELNLGLGRILPTPPVLQAAPAGRSNSSSSSTSTCAATAVNGMTDLWSTTTFNNDSDGKMAEKFKRLMGVKHGAPPLTPPSAGRINLVQHKRDLHFLNNTILI